MAELRSQNVNRGPVLRREVIVPRQSDAASIHRTAAVLSICIALVAGTLDAMLWQAAQRHAAEQRAGAVVEASAELYAPPLDLQRDVIAIEFVEDASMAPPAAVAEPAVVANDLAPACEQVPAVGEP